MGEQLKALAAEIEQLQQKAAKANPFTALPLVREAAAKQAQFNIEIAQILGGDV